MPRVCHGNSLFFRLMPVIFLLLSGCVSQFTGRLAENLSWAIVNNDDIKTVKQGGPAYLLMIDGLLRDDPENESLLMAGADLYTAYAGLYAEDEKRSEKLTDKGLEYALRAICVAGNDACGLRESNFEKFEKIINSMDKEEIPALYTLGASWAGWIQAHKKDWNAVAEISRVEAIMEKVLELDEAYKDGGAHLYLGILNTLLPPSLGGKPEKGKEHFEKALEISKGRNLMIKVIYAKQYARLVFDRDLHDRLLKEVLLADPDVEGYGLMNNLAKKEAASLLKSGEDYF